MTAIAIYSADPVLRCSLEQLLRGDPAMTVVGVADNPSAMLRLIDQNHVDTVLADSPPREQLADWQTRHGDTAFVSRILHSLRAFLRTDRPHLLSPQRRRHPGLPTRQVPLKGGRIEWEPAVSRMSTDSRNNGSG